MPSITLAKHENIESSLLVKFVVSGNIEGNRQIRQKSNTNVTTTLNE